MLLSDLFEQRPEVLKEMPYLVNKDMVMGQNEWTEFFSVDTLQRKFILMQEFPQQRRAVYINKEHNMAFIGEPGKRKADGKDGVHVTISVEFKNSQVLSHMTPSPQLKGALQVDLVEAHNPNMVGSGDGTMLYAGLVNKGLTIISDNTQYRGGKHLWKKIAAVQSQFGYVVNVIVDGKPYMDENGKPFVYNGSNLPDDHLWSERPPPRTQRAGAPPPPPDDRPDKYMTLFIMRKA